MRPALMSQSILAVMARAKLRPEWRSDEPYARRRELYVRAAPVFRKHGYRGATLKALADACGLSIPAIYRYFPSKKAFALFPLAALYPELQAPPPNVTAGDPLELLAGWVEAAAAEMPNYILAARLSGEVTLRPDEQRQLDANLVDHIAILGAIARHAAPHLDERSGLELARTMINTAVGPAITGVESEPEALRRQLRTLLRGYGLRVPRLSTPRPPASTRGCTGS
jgi:AcrR family transcriptional regulator